MGAIADLEENIRRINPDLLAIRALALVVLRQSSDQKFSIIHALEAKD